MAQETATSSRPSESGPSTSNSDSDDCESRSSESVVGSTYLISHSLFMRGMGLVYFAAVFSNYVQWPGLFGRDGLEPVDALLNAQRQKGLDSWGNFLSFPSLAWFAQDIGLDTDAFFEGLCLLNLAVAASVSLGFGNTISFAFLWVSYLTVQRAGQTFLGFQWDILLLEAGVIATIWAPVLPSAFARKGAAPFRPSHTVMWLTRFLLFKLMFMSGIVKLQAECPTWLELTALDYHYATQCIATPLAWYAHQLPPVVQQLSVAATYFIEIPLTLLILSPFRQQRHFAAAGQILLQILIILTGNYNFFNDLTIVLCFSLVDDGFWRSLFCCAKRKSRRNRHPLATFGSAPVVPLREALSWQFAEEHGLCEVFSVLGAQIDSRLRWVVFLLTSVGTAYSISDMFSVNVNTHWWNLTSSALSSHGQFDQSTRGLLVYGLINGVDLKLKWGATEATSFAKTILPWACLFAAVALCMNAMLDASRSAATAAPVVQPPRRPEPRPVKPLGKHSRPDGEPCCSLKCLRAKEQTSGAFSEEAAPRQLRSYTPVAATIRRTGAVLLSLLRSAAVLWIFAASCVTFRSLDKAFPRSLPRIASRAYSSVAPYGMVSSYGLFRRMTGVGRSNVVVEETFDQFHPDLLPRRRTLSIVERPEVIIQARFPSPSSKGGSTWQDVGFPWKPGDVNESPPFVAPFQPRLDWQMWFAALTRRHDALGGRNLWFTHLVVKLFDGSPAVAALLTRDGSSIAGGEKALSGPESVRALLYKYDFTRTNTSWNEPYINYQEQHHEAGKAQTRLPGRETQDWWSRTRPSHYMNQVDRLPSQANQDGKEKQQHQNSHTALAQLKSILAQHKGWRALSPEERNALSSRDARQRCSGDRGLFENVYAETARREYFHGFSNRDLCMLISRSRTFLLSQGLCNASGLQMLFAALVAVATATSVIRRQRS